MGKLLLYSFFIFLISISFYVLTFLNWSIHFIGINPFYPQLIINISHTLILISIILSGIELIPGLIYMREKKLLYNPIKEPKISIGMTAYNDEISIGPTIKEFKKLKEVINIVVIDNNCLDKTAEKALSAGAKVVKEPIQGYGSACIRALKEAKKTGNLICLVEGDYTFSASDLKKLFSYIENVDMVIGTRTTKEIVEPDSQITWFMQWGNTFIAKIIQLRYWGKLRLTDVGCTYRIIRPEALEKIIVELNVTGNHFSVDMILKALKYNLKIIECPVTFRKRLGESKGVGSNTIKGLINGLQMIWLILKS